MLCENKKSKINCRRWRYWWRRRTRQTPLPRLASPGTTSCSDGAVTSKSGTLSTLGETFVLSCVCVCECHVCLYVCVVCVSAYVCVLSVYVCLSVCLRLACLRVSVYVCVPVCLVCLCVRAWVSACFHPHVLNAPVHVGHTSRVTTDINISSPVFLYAAVQAT